MTERLAVAVAVATLWTGPDAPRDVDAPAVADCPDVEAWTAAMNAETRLGLHGRTLSQLLLGEPVDVVEERDGWARVVAPWQPSSEDARGYPGWLPRAHLAQPAEDTERHVVVTRPVASLFDEAGEPLQAISWATVLPLLDDSGDDLLVALPGGENATLRRADAMVRTAVPSPAYEPADLVTSGRQFLGLRYLWGGTCGWGLDCSGLVHLAFRVQGVTVPRDAHDQQAAAQPVELPAVRSGDLYFFRHPGEGVHHVGLVTGGQRMLHATEGEDRVEDAPLADHRVATLWAAGRFATTAAPIERDVVPGHAGAS